MFEFKLPDLGEGVHEGQVVNVLVQEGETIGEYQPMLEIETDKAAVEIPAPKGGVVAKIHVEPGQVVKVGQVLITIDDGSEKRPAGDGHSKEAAPAPAKPTPAQRGEEPELEPARAKAAAPVRENPAPTVATAPAAKGPVAAAPAVRKLARELHVDIHRIPGSGPEGRILREDVERFAAREHIPAAAPAAAEEAGPAMSVPAGELPDFSQYGPVRREAVPQIRKAIARQMTRAWLNVPRVTHCDSADVTELERNRKQYNAGLKEGEAKLTITAIVVKTVAAALREFPIVNASYDPAREEIIYKDYVHVGIAVDTPRGLVVPVLRDADRKPLPQIAAELHDLGTRAQALKLEIVELRGATFTITNVGALGGTFLTPMVNYPEVAILGLGAARLQPVVFEGQIVARRMLPLSLSFDHRIVDGADAARFTAEVIRSLENPLRLISLA